MRRFSITLVLLALIACGVVLPAAAQEEETRRVEQCLDVFRAITAISDRQVPDFMMKKAQGIAIFPGVRRAGFVVGVQNGSGVLVMRGAGGAPQSTEANAARPEGSWGPPLFLSLSGGSIGWQAGIQSVDLVLFFQTKKSIDSMLKGQFTLGVDASVAAGATGRQAAASTDSDLESEIYPYSRSRGFFAGLSLSGASIAVDYDANDAWYGKQDLRPREILSGAGLRVPDAGDSLRRAIAAYAKSVGD